MVEGTNCPARTGERTAKKSRLERKEARKRGKIK
ncbi:hypothetical protein N752_07655 [Desulforamulus aquiferis]|nr:hypothetical protein N752_07655 [Desulforamulus aquiferis]